MSNVIIGSDLEGYSLMQNELSIPVCFGATSRNMFNVLIPYTEFHGDDLVDCPLTPF